MNKILVSIVALLVAAVVFAASIPIFGSVSMETVTAENTGGGELRYILVDSHRQFSISLDEENGVLTVTNGTDKQTITDTDNFLYADSNFSIFVTSDNAIYLFGTGSDNEIVSTNLDIPVTVARVDGGVSVTDEVNTYSFGNPIYAYVPLSTGGYASYPGDTEVTLDSSVKDAFIGGYGGTTAYNGMNTGNYNLVLQKNLDGNVLSGGQWVAVSDTPDNPDLLNLVPLDIDPLDINPVPLGPNPGAQLMAVPTPSYTDGDWGYDLDSDNNAKIVSYSGSAGDITVPATVGGYNVIALGKGSLLQSVFNTSLSQYTVTISPGITKINASAFYGCTGLTSVSIPSTVTTLGDSAFNGCTGLTSVSIPSGVTTIGMTTFQDCTGLTSVSIPSTVTTLGNNSFRGCTSLTSFIIDENNLNFSSDGGILYNKDKTTLLYYPAVPSNFIVPDNVITIGNNSFAFCTQLNSITISGNVTTIEGSAFNGCTGLTSVIIKDGLESIGNYTFNNCPLLSSITIPSTVTTIANNTFTNKIHNVLNFSELEITGNNYGLSGAGVSDNIPVYLLIASTEIVHTEPKEGPVNTLLSQLPLIAALGLILGAISVMVIRKV